MNYILRELAKGTIPIAAQPAILETVIADINYYLMTEPSITLTCTTFNGEVERIEVRRRDLTGAHKGFNRYEQPLSSY